MYRYLDRPVHALGEPDRFVLAAVRQWVRAATTGRCACSAIADGFARRGVGGAVRDFAMAMAALHVDGRAVLALGRPCAAQVGEDEARLLAAFAAGRDGEPEALERMADALVADEAGPRFATAVRYVGVAMAAEARA